MGEPSETERVALGEAGPLLRFAAKRVKDLDPNLSLAIAKARAAADGNSWTPDISQYFWAAFSKLCDLIQPVTMDCLSAGNRNIEPCMFNRWRGVGKISLAERSSSRYLATLFVLILVILPQQLYVWTCTNLSKNDTYGANKSIIIKNAETFRKVAASTSGADHNYTQDELTVIDQLSADESTIRANLDRASYEASLLRRISTLSFGSANTLSPPTISNNWYEQYTSTLDRQNSQQVSALKTQEESDLVASILLSFIMPILFGAIGSRISTTAMTWFLSPSMKRPDRCWGSCG